MPASSPAGIRPLTMTEAAIPIVALIVLVGLSFYLFGDAGAKGPNQVALVLAAMVVFTLASVGCALSQSIGALVFFRAVQGLSAGAGMVVSRTT